MDRPLTCHTAATALTIAVAAVSPSARGDPPPVTAAVAPSTVAPAAPAERSVRRAVSLPRGLFLGSYGRIGWSADLRRGARAKPLNVVAHGPRLEEPAYFEIDLGYALEREDALSFRVALTLGFSEALLHYDGDFAATLAIRNLFAEADHVLLPGLSLWVGSRILRGDDIYLLDYWPLDDLNTLGGGLGLALGSTRVDLHFGVNRLADDYQWQTLEVPSPRGETEAVEVLDRQRSIGSIALTRRFAPLWGSLAAKVLLYGEVHLLPEGTFRREPLQPEALPDDSGWAIGAQLGLFDEAGNFVNLWLRAAAGLAAYDELQVPFGLGSDKRASGARELVLALAGNLERRRWALLLGAYIRSFRDADELASDPDDGWEYVAALRPLIYITRHFHQGVELSLQARRPDGLDPRDGVHRVPLVFKASLLPTLSWDRGSYSRPQLRLIYTVSYLDADARLGFAAEDPRHAVAVHHFLGAQAEWWYNSFSLRR